MGRAIRLELMELKMGLFRNGETLILKESSNAKRQLAALEVLRGSLPAAAEKQLEADIRAVRAGIAGEEKVLFELRNSHMDMVVLQDLFLEYGGLTAQIDFLVCTRQRFFVLECKSLYGNIEVNERGDFIRTFDGRKRECVYSPLTQNRRHLELIRAMRRDQRNMLQNMMFDRDFDDYYRSLIVLANPKTVLDDSKAPPKVKGAIVRCDQLIERIEAINAEKGPAHDKMAVSAMKGRAEWFLEQDKGFGGGDIAARYREMIAENAAKTGPSGDVSKMRSEAQSGISSEEPAVAFRAVGHDADISRVDGVRCPKCGATMVLRTAKRGEYSGRQFYGCSKYPKCKGIVSID